MNSYHHVLVDAKNEYTKQLVEMLTYRLYEGIKSIYSEAIDVSNKSYNRQYLKTFQQLLGDIPRWNSQLIDKEYRRILLKSDCDWMEDLITAVFVTHTKVLASIKSSKNTNSIDLKVPTCQHFIHKTYIETARQFWKRPDLLDHNLTKIEIQRNLSTSLELIAKSIEETIRKQLPVKNILKEYLGVEYINKKTAEIDDISLDMSPEDKTNLQNLVTKELKNSLENKTSKLDENYSNYSLNIDDNNIFNTDNGGDSDIKLDTKSNSTLIEELELTSNRSQLDYQLTKSFSGKELELKSNRGEELELQSNRGEELELQSNRSQLEKQSTRGEELELQSNRSQLEKQSTRGEELELKSNRSQLEKQSTRGQEVELKSNRSQLEKQSTRGEEVELKSNTGQLEKQSIKFTRGEEAELQSNRSQLEKQSIKSTRDEELELKSNDQLDKISNHTLVGELELKSNISQIDGRGELELKSNISQIEGEGELELKSNNQLDELKSIKTTLSKNIDTVTNNSQLDTTSNFNFFSDAINY